MRLLESIRTAPKRATALIAVAAAVVTVPAAVLAWGPTRPLYTVENPAPHVTFNSITNNPNIGDERNFVGIREKGSNALWKDTMNVEKGKEYTVRVYVHNNAADNLNASGKGIAKDTTARINLPTTTAKSIQVDGMISASNAMPKDVWDDAVFTGSENFNLSYVKGSLKYENNAFGAAGSALPESIFTQTGAKLGYDKLNGDFPGCFKYAGYISFTVKPQFAPTNNFEMKKEVRKTGTTTWAKSVEAKPGETVEYNITYRNTGETRQNNVLVNDYLPQGMTYVAGSSQVRNGTNPNGIKISDNVVQPIGVNVGDYNPAAAAYTRFTAKVEAKHIECGKHTLINKARVTVDGGYKEDTANVIVDKGECKPEDKYKQVCDIKTKQIITINEKAYDASKHAPVDSPLCKEQPKMVKVCNPVTGEIITVDEKDAGKYAPVGSDKCKEMEVCVIKTKETKTIKKSEFDGSIHTTDFSKCKDVPVTPPTPETPKTPETPAELPQTGMADVVAQLAGLFALTASGAYYLNSRRQA